MNIEEIVSNMTERQKQIHIDGVEFALNYRLVMDDEDKRIYDAIIEEKKNKKSKDKLAIKSYRFGKRRQL